jgi:MFS family permease
MAMTSVAWGAASLAAGAGSDRWGRRPFLVGGPVALALCMVGAAVSQTFLGVAVWATLAGGCAGASPACSWRKPRPAWSTASAAGRWAG